MQKNLVNMKWTNAGSSLDKLKSNSHFRGQYSPFKLKRSINQVFFVSNTNFLIFNDNFHPKIRKTNAYGHQKHFLPKFPRGLPIKPSEKRDRSNSHTCIAMNSPMQNICLHFIIKKLQEVPVTCCLLLSWDKKDWEKTKYQG